MDVFVQGKGKVKLTDKDYVAKGGQAMIYRRQNTVYKVYHDASHAIPVSKVRELQAITSKHVVRPQDVLLDKDDRMIGYTMAWVDGATLCEMFTQDWKDNNQFGPDKAAKVIRHLQTTINHIHSKGILIADLNELNCICPPPYEAVTLIDVDSYGTPSFPAQFVMLSIRDFHTQGFTKMSDWFAVGVLAFNLFMGMHPFKGRHPKYRWPIDAATLEKRMRENASVFDTGVKLPAIIPPFNTIPPVYLEWFRALFVRGERLLPPAELRPVVMAVPQVAVRVQGADHFNVAEVADMQERVVQVYSVNGVTAIVTTAGVYAGTKKLSTYTGRIHLAHTPKLTDIVYAQLVNRQLKLRNATRDEDIPFNMVAEQVMSYGGTIYFKDFETIYEIGFVEMIGAKMMPSVKRAANCHSMASKMYDGVVIQSVFDRCLVNVFPRTGITYCTQIKELHGLRIVDAKYDRGVFVVVVIDKAGLYDRHVFRFSTDHATYDHRLVPNVQYTGINFVVTDNGKAVFLNESEEIELFFARRNDPTLKVFADRQIGGDVKLFKDCNTVLIAKGNRVYALSSKVTPTP